MDPCYNQTKLHYLAMEDMKLGDYLALEMRLIQGLDINFFNVKNHSLLTSACDYRDETAVKWLIEHGADVNARAYPDAVTPLVIAATHTQNVKLLLAAHADVNAENNLNIIAATSSILAKNEGAFQLLMQAGTDINLLFKNNSYVPAFTHPISYQYIEQHMDQLHLENVAKWKKVRLKSLFK